jgi:hypothetical protein
MRYVSLVKSLIGVYYPVPTDSDDVARTMISTSSLSRMWCSTYTEEETDALIARHGGIKLPPEYARRLDYDSHAVHLSEHGV